MTGATLEPLNVALLSTLGMRNPNGSLVRQTVAGAAGWCGRCDRHCRRSARQPAREITEVFNVLADQLRKLSPGAERYGDVPEIASWYAASGPVLRVLSGLADGTDQIAFEALANLAGDAPSEIRPSPGRTRLELVAVLPSDASSYRDNSEVRNKTTFDTLLKRCDSVIELDGDCAPRPPESDQPDLLTRERRERAFRVQATVLLRQCDLLIAASDPAPKEALAAPARRWPTHSTLEYRSFFLPCAPRQDDAGVSLIGSMTRSREDFGLLRRALARARRERRDPDSGRSECRPERRIIEDRRRHRGAVPGRAPIARRVL